MLAAALGFAHAQQTPQPAEPLVTGVPGADLVAARCTMCHEAAHITRSRLTRGEWDDTIKLMIQRGAPITPDEEKVILDYLAKHYSRPGG